MTFELPLAYNILTNLHLGSIFEGNYKYGFADASLSSLPVLQVKFLIFDMMMFIIHSRYLSFIISMDSSCAKNRLEERFNIIDMLD